MKEQVQKFLAKEFPSLKLSDSSLEQLAWRLDGHTEYNTPEQAMIDTTHADFVQIKRIGGRLNSLDLVLNSDYDSFVEAQEKHLGAYNQILSQSEFEDMRQRFEEKDELFIDTLKVCTIVGGINLTQQVKERAKQQEIDFVNDSVQGMADLFADIEKAKEIFPLVKAHFEKYDASEHERITKLFQAAFSYNTHLRHMLYTECNQNGMRNIVQRMQEGKLDQEGLDFTINYWLTDIFGFRANACPTGSIYYTHNTHIAFDALCAQLNRVLVEDDLSAKQIFEAYLQKRAQWLGLDKTDLPQNDQMLLAHLGAMMRLFGTDHGQLLAAGMKLIPDELRKLSDVYFEDSDPSEPTATYVPALFANAIECRKSYYLEYAPKQILEALPPIKRKDNELRDLMATMDTTALFLSFYLKTLEIYRDKRAQDQLSDKRSPLSYRNFAWKPNIEKLFKSHPIFRENSPFDRKFNAFDTIEPVVNADGSVGHKLKGNKYLLPILNYCYLKLDQIKSWYYSAPSSTNQNGLFNLFGLLNRRPQSCSSEVQAVENNERRVVRGVI